MSLRRNEKPLLEDACQNGDLEALKLGLELKPEGDVTSALSAAARAVAEAEASGHTDSQDYTECFRTLSSAIQNHADEHKKLCAQLATLATGVGVAIAGLTTVEAAAFSAKFVALCEIVGEIANMYITGFPMGTVMSMVGFGSLLSSWDLSAFPHIIASISVLSGSVLLGSATSNLAYNVGENIGKKRGNAIYLEDGNTPLHIASKNNAYQCVSTLVDQWAGRDQQKWRIIKLAFSTIMNAISGGISASMPDFMERSNDSYNDLFLLTHRWDVNTTNQDGYTPLHFAAENNSARCLDALLGAGANINATDSKGWTALHFAAQNGHKESVEKLLCFKSDLKVGIKNNDGATALDLACRKGHEEIAMVLSGINRSKFIQGLHSAALLGNTEAIQKLLTIAPSLAKEKISSGETALHTAARNGQTEAIQTLLTIAPSLAKEKDSSDETALHTAARNGQTEAIQTLLTIAPSLAKEKDSFGVTALYTAARNGQTEAIQTLLTIAPSLAKEKDSSGVTALHEAAYWGQAEAIQTLLTIAPSLAKEKDSSGKTALHKAASGGNAESIQTLLTFDSSLAKVKDSSGETALCQAALRGRTDCKTLLERYTA
ncbi:ankyrin repeat domain-containing protein [Salinisphaera sp. G21_0]|uniref:ankyrin repeat domain-containing protein n=1 Tax=Salinisphaera sp. G21_0 TaxID=2821094 RepID=UPI001ADB848D|nr:ankyrin repeat domain-containing protein [Salinisphaera sp. G21_0]MBO9484594.1 ankyrin repeat domain-containing protein [Salinisphaera sp. G21_0]